ncbi:MAG: hypothetical protein WA737_02570 [Candidatus Acidiferrales bacterium]
MRVQKKFRYRCATLVFLLLAALAVGFSLTEPYARAGGPYEVTGPAAAVPGQAYLWNLASLPGNAVQYTLDTGPLSVTPSGAVVMSNAQGKSLVQQMFGAWQSVATSSIAYNNAGPIQGVPSGDVKTVADFNTVTTSCENGQQSPIIFDADGSITLALTGDSSVIGFTSLCDLDTSGGHILAAEVMLNGKFLDGVSAPQLSLALFNQSFTHEFGHFSGLDHSQINVDVLNEPQGDCNSDEVAGLPLMFPVLQCQARLSIGLPALAPDDMAWISYFYPIVAPAPQGKTATSTAYGYISGHVYFSDGVTPAQGVNVIAREVDDPATPQNESLTSAASAVSGAFFTGNPGQSVTCPVPNGADCNSGGSTFGSRDPRMIGTYTIPIPIPSGSASVNFTVSVESVNPAFSGANGLNPLNPPIPMPGSVPAPTAVNVMPGQTSTLDLTLLQTPSRFDAFENARLIPPACRAIWEDDRVRRFREA